MLDVAIKTQLKAYLERPQHAIELVATLMRMLPAGSARIV